MNRFLLSLACLFIFIPSASRADEQQRSGETASNGELPFRLFSGYLIEVEGRIGDQVHLKFVVDTGASISIIDQRIAEKLKLDLGAAKSFNFDRNLKWDSAHVPEVQFGPIRAANVAVLVGDLSRYSEFAKKADAIIGMDLLTLRDITIDFGARTLIFDSSTPRRYLAGVDPMVACLTVELRVQNHPVRLIADTGSPSIIFYEERLRMRVPGLRTSGSTKNATMGGRVPVKQATLPDVVFGKRNREIPVVFLPSPAPDTLAGIDGIMGISALQARRVHFNFSEMTLSWE